MKALDQAFANTRAQGRRALMPFLMSGHPTGNAFAANLAAAAEFADVIEVGVPFSDPLADGPIIQAAAAAALKQGTTLAATLETLRTRKSGPPVVLMLSVNQVLAAGLEGFAKRAAYAGVSGVIVPDLPFEEASEVLQVFKRHSLALISMLAPTTVPRRAKAILNQAQGFVYLISVAGVTGTRDTFPPETIEYIRRAGEQCKVPVCVGFGISSPAHIEQLRNVADGFIVGSALIRAIDEGRSVRDVLAPLRQALTTDNRQLTTEAKP